MHEVSVGHAQTAEEWDELLRNSSAYYKMISSSYFEEFDSTLRYSPVIFVDDEPAFLLPLQKVENDLVSHPQLPWGGFICLRQDVDGVETVLGAAISEFLDSFGHNLDSLRIKCKPQSATVSWNEPASLSNFGLLNRLADTYTVELSEKIPWSSRRVRGLRQAEKAGVNVRPCVNGDEIHKVWEKVEDFYHERGLPQPLSEERIVALVARDFATLLVADISDLRESCSAVVATALCYRLGGSLRVPIYAAFDRSIKGATEALISNVVNKAHDLDIGYVDLGRSVDPETGELVQGIAEFKEECGARPEPTFEVEIRLN